MHPEKVDRMSDGNASRRRGSRKTALRHRPSEPLNVRLSPAPAILDGLRLLDVRFSAAADAIKTLFGPDSSRDMFRGLHIKPTDVDVSLRRAPVAPLFGPLGYDLPLLGPGWTRGTHFERLQAVYDLSSFDLDVLVVALAPEIDARYERLFAFIQDDVTRKRPTVDVALN